MTVDFWQCGEKAYLECDSNFSKMHANKISPSNFRSFFMYLNGENMPAGTYYRAVTYHTMWLEEYILLPNGVYLERLDH